MTWRWFPRDEQRLDQPLDLVGLAVLPAGVVANGVSVSVFAFDVAGDRIKRIWAVRNPDKLRPWTVGPQH